MTAIAVLVALDWVLKRKTFMKQMMMAEEDIKRGQKDQDGDPHTKQRGKKISKEITLGDNASNTRKADVVITNLTHFAVAMGFQHIACPYPMCWRARSIAEDAKASRYRASRYTVAAVYRTLYQLIEQKAPPNEAIELGTDPEDPELWLTVEFQEK